MKRIDWGLVLTIGAFVVLTTSVLLTAYLILAEEESGQDFVGKKVIFNNDTLIVVNYNYIGASYDLSNGLTIDQDLLQSLDTLNQSNPKR